MTTNPRGYLRRLDDSQAATPSPQRPTDYVVPALEATGDGTGEPTEGLGAATTTSPAGGDGGSNSERPRREGIGLTSVTIKKTLRPRLRGRRRPKADEGDEMSRSREIN